MIALNSNQGNVYENRAASSEQIQNIVATPNEGLVLLDGKVSKRNISASLEQS